jgi:hypothetical protein
VSGGSTFVETIGSSIIHRAATNASARSSITSSQSNPIQIATEVASNGGLITGAKAGIGFGVALVVIIALLLALFCFRRRKKQSMQREKQDLETADALATQQGHEMITSANTHEMDAKRPADFRFEDVRPDRLEGFQELETQDSPPVNSITRPEGAAELDAPYTIQSTNVGSIWEHLPLSELDASMSATQRAELHSRLMDPRLAVMHPLSAPLPIPTTLETERPKPLQQELPSKPIASSSTPNGLEDKLEVLRKRMEGVREDKERLEKIQALKELEEELQAEILVEQKKASGT